MILLRAAVAVDVADGERHDLAEPGPGLVEEANHEVGQLALIGRYVDELEHFLGGLGGNFGHGNLLEIDGSLSEGRRLARPGGARPPTVRRGLPIFSLLRVCAGPTGQRPDGIPSFLVVGVGVDLGRAETLMPE